MLPPRLDTAEALELHLAALLALDARLAGVALRAGAFDLRIAPSGFAGMAKIVCGQQLSVASARAIWTRFAALPGALEAASYVGLDEQLVLGAGFSRGKHKTLRALAEAVIGGDLRFDAVQDLPAEAAVAALTRIHGIGPWTAELYLMFCAGHADIFPAGDLALQKAVAHGLGMSGRPTAKQAAAIAEAWAPHRATAALLFWRYFAALRDREGLPL